MGNETKFIKSVFYKTCFFIGLGTMGAWSFGQVSHWVGDDVSSAHSQSFRSKVSEIILQPAGLKDVVERVVEKIVYIQVPANPASMTVSAVQAAPVSITLNPDGTRPGDFPVDANGIPIPGATPYPAAVVTPSPSAPDAVASASPSDPNQAAPSAPVAPPPMVDALGNAIPVPEVEIAQDQEQPPQVPYVPYMPYDPSQMGQAAPVAQAPSDSNGGAAQTGGTVGTGIPSNPNSNGSFAAGTTGGSSPVTTQNAPAAHTLSSSDMTLLNIGMKGLFSDQTVSVSGSQCQYANGATSGCTPVNSTSVHTNRWDVASGLVSNAGFSVKASSTSQVQVTLNLSIQDDSLATQSYPSTVTASQITVHTENRNGKNFRVIELDLPNMVVRGKDTLSAVTATLVFDTTTNALASDSQLTFARSEVTTVGLPWDSSPNRTPASSSDSVIDASQITYSMEIDKS